ncbi:MAG: CvpA family protein [Planctomycetota bacterium]
MDILGVYISLIDVILGLFLLFCMAWGAMRGLTTQLARLVTLFLGITAARQLGPQLAPVLSSNFENIKSPTDLIAAYILLFLAVCLGVSVLTWFLKDVLSELKLKKYDRIFGAFLGGVGGSVFSVLLMSFFLLLFPKNISLLTNSQCAPVMCFVLEKVQFIFPDILKEVLNRAVQQIRSATQTASGAMTTDSTENTISVQTAKMMQLVSQVNKSLRDGRSPVQAIEDGMSQLLKNSASTPNTSSDVLKNLGHSPQMSVAEKLAPAQVIFVSNPSYCLNFRSSLMGANGSEIAKENSFLDPWEEVAIGAYQSGGEFRLRFVLSYPKGNAEQNIGRLSQNLRLSWPEETIQKRFSELLDIRKIVPEQSFLVAEFALQSDANFARWIEEADLPFLYFRD